MTGMEKKSKTLEKVALLTETLSDAELASEKNLMSSIHIMLCIAFAFAFTIFHFFGRPLSLDGIFSKFDFTTLAGLIAPAMMAVISQSVMKKKIDNIELLTADKKQLQNLKALHISNWTMLGISIGTSIMFYFVIGAGPAVAVVGLLTLLLLYSNKPNYDI